MEASSLVPDTPELRKARGAYLAEWAVEGDPAAKILDPTCGEAVFLPAAGRSLAAAGAEIDQIRE